jgi:hypothetical protein
MLALLERSLKQLCNPRETLKAIPFPDQRVSFRLTKHASIIFKPLIRLAMMRLKRECKDCSEQNMMREC